MSWRPRSTRPGSSPPRSQRVSPSLPTRTVPRTRSPSRTSAGAMRAFSVRGRRESRGARPSRRPAPGGCRSTAAGIRRRTRAARPAGPATSRWRPLHARELRGVDRDPGHVVGHEPGTRESGRLPVVHRLAQVDLALAHAVVGQLGARLSLSECPSPGSASRNCPPSIRTRWASRSAAVRHVVHASITTPRRTCARERAARSCPRR